LPNRQYYILKFNSSWLREFDFNIHITFEQALKNKKVIALADNQMLRTIRKITHHNVDMDKIEFLFQQRDKIKLMDSNKENISKIKYLQKQIYGNLYIPEFVVISIESATDYDIMFDKGLFINNKKYIRTSCSASQGRVSKVVFCEETVAKQLLDILDNGRNHNIPFSPSKYNAYLGTASSATKIVTTPRFCVIPDCTRSQDVDCWWVTEVDDKNKDDIIDKRTINTEFNLFDGNGLISPAMAQQWADDLGLDYLPAQWCIRASWVKGMVNVFDFHQFCKEYNNGNYIINTVYKDSDGKPIRVDLRDIDVILTESQFKLWDSYSSLEEYQYNSKKNSLNWGVSLYTPKQDKDILNLNYQFIQTLNLDKEKVEKLCEQTVEYFNGVSLENYWYTILFLMGNNLDNEKLSNFLYNSNNNWLKSLVVDKNLIKDKYIREKIFENIKVKLDNACMGRILVDGNFQVIVPDSFAFMEHACGLEVKGLIPSGSFYSNYWNNKNANKIDCMRSPLTYLSEHQVYDLYKNDLTDKWFKYSYTGIITNIYDDYTLHFGGSDFDYDILATTNNEIMVNNTYTSDMPVVGKVEKPKKWLFEPKDLQVADKFTFGSIIGQITNNVTTIRCLMADFDENSEEYQILINRMRMGCKLQSLQIDKAKIGRAVKGIPTVWKKWQKITEEDTEEIIKEKQLFNSILCDKHPYFFIYLYKTTKTKYKKWLKDYDTSCRTRWNVSVTELESMENKTEEQILFLERYYKACPVVDNNSAMNLLCHYMEGIKNNIKINIKDRSNMSYIDSYKTVIDEEIDTNTYNKIYKVIKELREALRASVSSSSNKNDFCGEFNNDFNNIYEIYKNKLFSICSNQDIIVNCLIDIFYIDFPSYNKDILWNLFGDEIFQNVLKNNPQIIDYPVLDESGDILYLGKKYRIEQFEIKGGDNK
jgi:hypothetical protein